MKKKTDSRLKLFKLKIPFEETEEPTKDPGSPGENSSSEFGNSRCVPVGTILIAPDGRNEKKKFRGEGDLVKFRCSSFKKNYCRSSQRRN